jgi:MFS family permease
MKRYRLINNLTGWGVFLFSAIIYLLTIEPTASLWDCGEFVASGLKLEVGHPPGNPVFMLMANFFSHFALGNTARVAAMVNSMSALASAFAILFLFWTITHLSRKIIIKGEEQITTGRVIAVMAAGIVGSIAYAFSDSFWFSAVEGEVYASSSFFTALVVWAMLKWEDAADEKYGDKWIILIAFLTGLSIGVHLLNLLTIPALTLIYYFRKYEFSWKGFLISTTISFILLGLVLFGLIPGVIKVSDRLDMFFVNSLNLPVNSGTIFHVILLIVFFILAIRATLSSSGSNQTAILSIAALFLSGIWIVTDSAIFNIIVLIGVVAFAWYITGKDSYVLNMALTSVAVLLIGFSANAIIFIRASANTPLNENNPSNPNNFLYFINREQYGQRPLFKGPYFNAPVLEYKDSKARYSLVDGKYKVTSHDIERVYDERFLTLFPRMWSDQNEHDQAYKEWSRMKGVPLQVTDQNGKKKIIRKPTFGENLRFLLSYQIDYMYFRYFMWNFSGRQNDTQAYGGAVNGNWISGINFIDQPRIGTSDMPAEMKNDPSRNVYYMLPFILGLVGLFYHYNRDKKFWWIVMLLFLMTGLAIIIYLNQTPVQPRERDYAYAGSFYFFAIWIGIGVLALFELLSKFLKEKIAAPVAGIVCTLAVPVIMGTQNYDDHDRSGRYLARDVACNYLNSCAPDAILFTNGDNDTFPLWYAQEVENVRTDVRVCNLMLLNTDWYIDQMKYRTHESAPLPVTLPSKKYFDGVNNQVFIVEKTKEPVDVKTIIEWVNSDNPATKVQVSANETLDIIPSRTIRIPVDAAKVIEAGVVKPEDKDKIVPYIDIKLKGSSIMKSSLIVLDILAHNDWKRPIYFVTGYHNDAMGLEEYFQLEGVAYRLVPIKSENKSWLEYGRVDPDILYNNLMKKFLWRGAKEKGVDIDYNHKRTLIVVKARYNYARLAKVLAEQGKYEKAKEVLDYCMETFPPDKIPFDMYMPDIVDAYLQSGATEKGIKLSKELSDYFFARLEYYLKQDPDIISSADYEIQSALQYISKTANALKAARQDQLATEYNSKVESYYTKYVKLMKGAGSQAN